MRFFGGLTVEESAEALHVSVGTIMRDWRLAKTWLARELERGMTPDRWSQIERVYHLALERAAGERDNFLTAGCAGDEALRHEVESLLAHDGKAAFLSTPAVVAHRGGDTLVGQARARMSCRRGSARAAWARSTARGTTNSERDVAIKVLPRAFSSRPRAPGAFRARSAHAGRAQSPAHRRHLRCRGCRRLRALSSSWSKGRRSPSGSTPGAVAAQRSAADRAADRRGARGRARPGASCTAT